ncbi:tetratricopeptide repeat protein [Halonatronum saccharophilum]|uniref:tetratricopeptide repeat protein n=1 Tax=Halonatronum saccharophilum TaxID=150060 RepID=UPI000483BF22|nr:tetratricopeptide repeat protein [Halonatronum saccharophilum]
MKKNKSLSFSILICLLMLTLINLQVDAQSNLNEGEELYLEARSLYYNPKGETEKEQKENINRAISLLEESKEVFTEVNNKYESYYWQGRTEFLLAEINEAIGENRRAAIGFQKAEGLAEKALREEASSQAHSLLADSYMRQFNYRGNMYVMQYGPTSLRLLQRAVSMDSSNYRALNSLGNYYYFAPEIGGGDRNKAIRSLNRALASDDKHDNFISYIWLGVIMREEGDITKAEEYFNKALEIYPNSLWAKAELEGGIDYVNY